MKRAVAVGESVEVPGPVEQLAVGHDRAGTRPQHGGAVHETELAQHGTGQVLALEVRADGDAGRQEPEPGEAQTGPEVVALGAVFLRDRAQHDEPVRVPPRPARRAEGVDALRAGGEEVAAPSVRCQRTWRPARSDVSRPSSAERAMACLAFFSSTSRRASASTSVPVHTAPPRGSTSSPSTVSRSALALEPARGRRVALGTDDILQTLDGPVEVRSMVNRRERGSRDDRSRHRACPLPPLAPRRRRPHRHPDPAGRPRRRPPCRLRAEAELLRPRRRHRAGRRGAAPALRAPRGARRRAHRRARQGVLRRRQHPDAGRLHPRTTRSNFCKFTNETRNAIEDATRALGPGVARGGQRHGGGRRLRAGAGLRRDPAGRRPVLGRLAARGAAAGRAARHRRAHPRGRQAPRAARPRRRVRHPRRGREGAAGASTGGSSTRSPRAAGSTTVVRGAGRGARGRAPTAPPTSRGIVLAPLDRRPATTTAGATTTSTSARPRRSAWRAITDRRARATPATTPSTAGLLAACRELDDAMLHLRFNEPEVGTWVLRTEGDPTPSLAADGRSAATPTTGSSARSGSAGRGRSSASTCRPARWSPSSSPAAASPARWPSWCWPPTARSCSTGSGPDDDRPPAALRLTDANDGWYPMANG